MALTVTKLKRGRPSGVGKKFLAARYQPDGTVKAVYGDGGEPMDEVVAAFRSIGIDSDSIYALVGHTEKAAARHAARHRDTGQFVPAGHPRQAPAAGLFRSVTPKLRSFGGRFFK